MGFFVKIVKNLVLHNRSNKSLNWLPLAHTSSLISAIFRVNFQLGKRNRDLCTLHEWGLFLKNEEFVKQEGGFCLLTRSHTDLLFVRVNICWSIYRLANYCIYSQQILAHKYLFVDLGGDKSCLWVLMNSTRKTELKQIWTQ